MHGIKLNPGVSRTDFEKFMSEEGFAMGDVLTRAGAVATQYLLTDTTGQPPLAFEDSNLSLESFGNRTSVTKYHVVGTWRRIDKEGV
jgi:hypothetical protein